MAETTEAACLLDHGALYGKRLLLQPPQGDPIFAGFKQGAFSLYYGDAPYFHFDRDGRWQRALVDGVHYLKALDTQVQTIDRVRTGENLILTRRTLNASETTAVDESIRERARALIEAIDGGQFGRIEPPSKAQPIATAELRDFLNRIAGWDPAVWSFVRDRYAATYGPLPFIPPDSPAPLILQATIGDASGRSFGGGRSVPLQVRTPAEFEAHVTAVAGLMSQRITQCKSIFLGGSALLRQPIESITTYLKTVTATFPIDPAAGRKRPALSDDLPHQLSGIHAFLDDFAAPLPDAEGWGVLKALGLVRVGLGVESGSAETRAEYGKTWPNQALLGLVTDLKAAGIGVSVYLLVGAGGAKHNSRHLGDTVDLVYRLELRASDLVTLLDAEEVRMRSGGDTQVSAGFAPLTPAETTAQRERIHGLLGSVRSACKAKVVTYSLEKQALA